RHPAVLNPAAAAATAGRRLSAVESPHAVQIASVPRPGICSALFWWINRYTALRFFQNAVQTGHSHVAGTTPLAMRAKPCIRCVASADWCATFSRPVQRTGPAPDNSRLGCRHQPDPAATTHQWLLQTGLN